MEIEHISIIILLTSVVISLLLLPRLAHIASRIGLLDHPNLRTVHNNPKPLVGGIGMVVAVAASCMLFVPLAGLRGFWAGVILLVIVGFLDDFKELDHRWKFVAQMVAGLMMILFSRVLLVSFGKIISMEPLSVSSYAFTATLFCVVGVVNAINMIDGLDGLAGGVSLVGFVSFAVLSYLGGQWGLFLINVAIIGALIGFLRYNWHQALLFMGDAGSLFLGFSLAFMAIALTQGPEATARPIAPLLILAMPIADTVTVMVKRVLGGNSPFCADKQHLHHIFMRLGLSKRGSVLAISGLSVFFATVAVLGEVYQLSEQALFAFFSIAYLSYFLSSFHIKKIVRVKGKIRRAKA